MALSPQNSYIYFKCKLVYSKLLLFKKEVIQQESRLPYCTNPKDITHNYPSEWYPVELCNRAMLSGGYILPDMSQLWIHLCMLHAKLPLLYLTLWFSRQEYWSGLPCPPPRDRPNSGIDPGSLTSPAFAGRFFTTSITCEAPTRYLDTLSASYESCPSQ